MKDSFSMKICSMTDDANLSGLTARATVSCGICGAKAHDPRNVCDPNQLPDVGSLGD